MQPEQPIQPTYTPQPTNQGQGFTLHQKRIMLFAGIPISIMLLVIIFAMIFGGNRGPTETALTSVTARNSELLRLITAFEKDLKTGEGQTYAARAKILLSSDNLQLTDYTLSAYGSTHSEEQLANTEIASTIESLNARVGQSDFDAVFISSVQFEIKLNKDLLEQLDLEDSEPVLGSLTETAILNYESLL